MEARTLSRLLALATMLVTTNINAENNIDILGGLAYNKKQVEFTPAARRPTDITIDGSFNTVDVSLTALYKKMYVSANYDTSFDESVDINKNNDPVTRSRKDYGITLGYNILDQLSLFGGYKYGRSTAEVLMGISAISGPGIVKTDFELFSSGIEEEGPFLGTAFSFSLGKSATASINLAYADMNGTYSRLDPASNSIPVQTVYKGDITGLSYGITFGGQLKDNLLYRIGYKVNRYEFESRAEGGQDGKEDFESLTLGIISYLN